MKKLLILSAAALGMALGSCSDDARYDLGNGDGEGRVMLRATINADLAKSREITPVDQLGETAMIWISNEKGLIRRYNGESEIPANGITLLAGNYLAEVWAGDSVSASFTDRWFKGSESFTVGNGTISQVNVVARIANVVASVVYEEGVAEVLSDVTMTVGHKCGTLEYNEETQDQKGYFMMPSIDKDLTWTLNGTNIATGEPFTKTGTIADAKPGTEYILTVKHTTEVGEPAGAAFITVTVDESALEVEDEFTILAPPSITGIGFDASQPVIAEPGRFTRKSLWIAATGYLKAVEMRCDAFTDLMGIGGNDFEIFGMHEDVEAAVKAAGLSWTYTTHEDTGMSEMKISFEKELLNALPGGEHTVYLTVTDVNGKTSNAFLSILASDALARTEAVDPVDVWATTAVINASIMKDDATGFGLKYRVKGTQQWTAAEVTLPATIAKNALYTADLAGLTPGTTYEYVAYADGFESTDVLEFTTEAAAQLPNSGFEEWGTDGKEITPYASAATRFWHTGNAAAAPMTGKNMTTQATDIYHSGSSAARLKSENVIVQFAAGNIFVGEFLSTDGMAGILGWGRPFTSRPKAFKVWVKYRPVAITQVKTNPLGLAKGDMDQGTVYVAVLNNVFTGDSNADYAKRYPTVIRNKAGSTARYFSKDDANVIGFGQRIFTEATEGEGLIEITVPISYEGYVPTKAAHIICVASSSIGGDYFTGGDGSEMIIDDFELVY